MYGNKLFGNFDDDASKRLKNIPFKKWFKIHWTQILVQAMKLILND